MPENTIGEDWELVDRCIRQIGEASDAHSRGERTKMPDVSIVTFRAAWERLRAAYPTGPAAVAAGTIGADFELADRFVATLAKGAAAVRRGEEADEPEVSLEAIEAFAAAWERIRPALAPGPEPTTEATTVAAAGRPSADQIKEDFELLARHLESLAGVVAKWGPSEAPTAVQAATERAAKLVAALERIRAAWPEAAAFPIAAPRNAIFDKYSSELGTGSVHVVFAGYPGKLSTVEDVRDLARRQCEAIRSLANAVEAADYTALAHKGGEPS